MSVGDTIEGDDAAWPTRGASRSLLLLLCVGAVVSQMDRQVISLMIGPLKAEFGLSDSQFGALQGVAFGLFYTFMAVPIGWLADRGQRRIVIGAGIALFSAFSLATGLARTFSQLFVARVGVGVGEASLNPAGFSLISDSFPRRVLGRATSLFTMSNFIGTSIALAGGGALIGWLDHVALTDPSRLHGVRPWQAVFLLISIPGFLLAPCFLLLREPARRGLAGGARMSFSATLREVRARAGYLVPLALGMAMVTTVSYAVVTWTPALFIRVYGWSPAKVGAWLGLLILIGSTSGSYFAGWLTDRLTQRGVSDAPLKVSILAFAGCWVAGVLAPQMPSPGLALALIFLVTFFKCQPLACAPVTIQTVVPNRARGQISGLYLTVISLVGLLAGPVVVGVLNDRLFPQPTGVRYSLSLVIGLSCPVMIALIHAACRPYRRLVDGIE